MHRIITKTFLVASFSAILLWLPGQSQALKSHIQSRDDLLFGTVLYETLRENHLQALVEHEILTDQKNTLAISENGRLLKGSLMLSMGLTDDAQTYFKTILDSDSAQISKNKSWYYLAKLRYQGSELEPAKYALSQITGNVPQDIEFDLYYLTTLLQSDNFLEFNQLPASIRQDKNHALYPYLLFNQGIILYNNNQIDQAVSMLNRVADHSAKYQDQMLLQDRAMHAISQIMIQQSNLTQAWTQLENIRTNGLYSNRGLATYAWTAIELEQYGKAIAALNVLNSRSIANPEVQEARVLLPHLYEKMDAKRKALKSNLMSIKELEQGIQKVNYARQIIRKKDVPREFIINLDMVKSNNDWGSQRINVDYKGLTPFLIDLLASNQFNNVLALLSDLYLLIENLDQWNYRIEQLKIVLESVNNKTLSQEIRNQITRLNDRQTLSESALSRLQLLAYTFDTTNQKRISTLLDHTERYVQHSKQNLGQINTITSAFRYSRNHALDLQTFNQRVNSFLRESNTLVKTLETIMRTMVEAELDKHQDRMEYYIAQSRLATARLYDEALVELEDARDGE